MPLQFSEQLSQMTYDKTVGYNKYGFVNNEIEENKLGIPIIGITIGGGNALSDTNINYTEKILQHKNVDNQIIYLGYTKEYIKQKHLNFLNKHKNKIKYIKIGPYIDEQKNYGIYYGSLNQKIYDIELNNIEELLPYKNVLKIDNSKREEIKKFFDNNKFYDDLIELNTFQGEYIGYNFQLPNELSNSVILSETKKYVLGINNIFGLWLINNLETPFLTFEIGNYTKSQIYGMYIQMQKYNNDFQIETFFKHIKDKQVIKNGQKIQVDTIFDNNLRFKRNYNDLYLLKKLFMNSFYETNYNNYFLQNEKTSNIFFESFLR